MKRDPVPATPDTPVPEANVPPPPAPTGPFIHVENRGRSNVRVGGRFVGPNGKLILRGAVPGGVCIVDRDGAVLARVPEAEVGLLARMQAAGTLWCSDETYLVAARPKPAAPGTDVRSLSW